MGLAASGVLVFMTAGCIAAMTWAAFYLHGLEAPLEHLKGEIVRIDSMNTSSGVRFQFGKYTLDVRYRSSDGRDSVRSIRKNTYGFVFRGESINLVSDPRTGSIEASAFPEMWIVMTVVDVLFAALIVFVVKTTRTLLRGT